MDSKYIYLFEDSLLPTQDYLEDYKLFNIFYSFFYNKEKNLPIVPIREHPSRENQYLVLDGHHRITIAGLFNKPLNCFVAQSKYDLIDDDDDSFDNFSFGENPFNNIFFRWDDVLYYESLLDFPKTFKDLRFNYSFLKNFEVAKNYFKERGFDLEKRVNLSDN